MQNLKFQSETFCKSVFIPLLLILLFLFQACKKADILNSLDKNSQDAISKQAKDFFTLAVNAPVEEKAIVTEMQNQLKENDVQDFLNWHGQPVWSKIIKFEAFKNGTVTYAIPTQKNEKNNGIFCGNY